MKFNVVVAYYGCASVEAESEDAAREKANALRRDDVEWDTKMTVEIVRKEEDLCLL